MKPKPDDLLSWANSHPVKTTLLSLLLFGAIPVTINLKWPDDPVAWLFGACVIVLLGGALCFGLHSRKIITLFLIAVMVAAPVRQIRAAMYGVGVIVICVGGYCVYKVVKVCQKKFPPKNTNAPPEEFTAAGSEYGAACEYSSIGSCYTPPSFNASSENPLINPTTFTLNVMVEREGAVTSMSANNAEGTAQDWASFQSEMASHGLFLVGHPSQPQAEIGGVPCDPSLVPLEFDPFTGRVTHHTGEDLMRVVVERSPNLTDWYPLLVTDTGVGSGFKVVDTTREGQMFYRVQVSQP